MVCLSCVCGYMAIGKGGNFARHQKTCREHYAHLKTLDIQSELEKKYKIISLLENSDAITVAKHIQYLETQLTRRDEELKEKDEQIQKLENALIRKPSNLNVNTTNIHTENVNNVVMINAWGNETFDHITEEDKIHALRNYMTAIPNIVEQIHFGGERRNRNVKLTNKRSREILIYKETPEGIKQVHEDIDEVLEDMIANGKFVLDPVAERFNMTRYKKFREELRESERLKSKLYANQKNAVRRKLMDNAK